MAKRTRYPARTTSRPAARRAARAGSDAGLPASVPARSTPLDEPIGDLDDMPVRSSGSLTEDELERAARLEAEVTAKERAAIAESLRRRARSQAGETHLPGDVNAPLSVRAAHEYAYVARDVRRIILTASLMVAILAVLAILVNVLGVITL